MLPLAAFTWKYGKVNIAQSIGNQGNIYVDHHRVAERWSIEGWTYYPELLMNQLPWVALVLVMAGMLVMGWDTQARKKQGIWLWTALAWYAMFSYFDNKQIRFVAYAMPRCHCLHGCECGCRSVRAGQESLAWLLCGVLSVGMSHRPAERPSGV
ncbi:MAG: hypothetical protein R3C12_16145 [Planctomycetaceae bacterium]